MKLQAAPNACPSINVAGVEYTADPDDGTVDITDPVHIAVAQREGFTEVEQHQES